MFRDSPQRPIIPRCMTWHCDINRDTKIRVILIGGTSHAGKSTTARYLADLIGWDLQSTDKLARHPGRPWNTPDFTVSPHVAEHYRELSVDDLVTDVLRHYQQNVVPQVKKLIDARTSGEGTTGLIIEGSAIYPDFVAPLISDQVLALWLTAPDELLVRRIYAESGFDLRLGAEQFLIDKFLQRTLAFNRRITDAIGRHGLVSIAISNADTSESVAQKVLKMVEDK
jgi:2-phosphoglycerate kinase